ncbi:hypothetical protein QTP86_000452 [Hemibagrus guttatus]|nr:hypothetical protein QTP86_000452 [Hemibagrus guttatus]
MDHVITLACRLTASHKPLLLSGHVDFATRGMNTLDLVYTNISSAYHVEPRPHLGYSEHISVTLIPAYRPLVRRTKPILKQVKTWPAGATSALQDCFECTDWNMFREAPLLKLRDSAFRAGDKTALKTARAKLSRAIREVKPPRQNPRPLQAIMNYKTTSPACDSDASLPDALNDFYARFKAQNSVAARKTILPPNDQVLCFSTAEVKRTLCRVNPR